MVDTNHTCCSDGDPRARAAGSWPSRRSPSGLARALSLALVVLTAGCAGARPTCKVPSAVELEVETSDRVNRDAEGRSLPTLLRLYQLRDFSRLQMASADDVFENPKDTLGDTLLGTEEVTLYPGQVIVKRFQRNPQADYVVGVAIFRNPVGSAWRTVQEFPMPGDPCAERNDPKAAPRFVDLRIRMFLENYRIESVSNYAGLPRRSCVAGDSRCAGATGDAPNELPEELRHRRLRSFDEDSSRPKPTVGGDEK
jgi:type VI secretion system protein VasD